MDRDNNSQKRVINTNDFDLLRHNSILMDKLTEQKKEIGFYSSSDVALVRVCEHLPVEGIIPSISNVPFVCKIRDLAHSAVGEVVSEENITFDSQEEEKNFIFELCPYSTQYRSTVHSCLNGIVSNHSMGTFDGSFVVIDRFNHHENDNNLLAIRPEDTYFEDGFQLSDSAIILIDVNNVEKVVDAGLENDSRIIFYDGDRKTAVDTVLLEMGIVPERIGQHNVDNSNTSELLIDFVRSKGGGEKHSLSSSYANDDLKSLQLWKIYGKEFYSYLFSSVYGNNQSHEFEFDRLVENCVNPFDNESLDILKGIIREVGLDNYRQIVNDFNNIITNRIASGTFPTNNDILKGVELNINSNNYTY